MAEHTGGDPIGLPEELDRELLQEDIRPVEMFLSNVMPQVTARPHRHATCMYTNSPDGNFIVDQHPLHERVVFGAGFSGHGFKFTSVLGKALAELALDGSTQLPIQFLNCRRASIQSMER